MGNTSGKPVVFTDEVNLNHFRLLRVVGKGAFGKVRIVERKDTGLTFALKYIRKDEVVRSESVRNIIRERRMLEHLNHPFLLNLRYSFQDMEYLYIVQDLMNGGDLRFHISRKTMTEDAVQFWMAELACALRYIHNQGIVHRDLKPDNVLLDSEGHVHLADFNVASEFRRDKPLHSKSGTLAYLAPEVYGGKGYLDEVDWWSLGVTFYECIYNKRPFEAHHHDKLEKEILKANPAYPVTNPPVSMPCVHAISSLLEKDIHKRIGAMTFESYESSPFFRAIDFVQLEKKQIPPIFIPSSEKTNFDATYDLEELLLEEAPLEARARRQKPRAALKDGATDKEVRDDELHRMIETLFEPFDYTIAPHDPATLAATEPPGGSKSSGSPELTSHSKSSGDDNTRTANSSATTPNGSPPLHATTSALANDHNPEYFGHSPGGNGNRLQKLPTGNSAVGRSRGATRSTSRGGGMQVTLDASGSWSELADKSATLPAEGKAGAANEKGGQRPTGMLGFLSRKGVRARSPKPREAGVLGKEGARVIISGGK